MKIKTKDFRVNGRCPICESEDCMGCCPFC
jgi:hypothetical protein